MLYRMYIYASNLFPWIPVPIVVFFVSGYAVNLPVRGPCRQCTSKKEAVASVSTVYLQMSESTATKMTCGEESQT